MQRQSKTAEFKHMNYPDDNKFTLYITAEYTFVTIIN